jgi:hypothetical protein
MIKIVTLSEAMGLFNNFLPCALSLEPPLITVPHAR